MSPAEKAHRRRWWTMLVLSLSLLVISLDNTILNVALPSLSSDLGASASELQWIVDAYTLVFAGMLLAAGSLSDRYGRKKALYLGMTIFGIGSLASSVAGTANHLIGTRAVMGFGAAFIMPATLSILTNVFPPRERGRAIGIWAAMAGVGVPLGPILGGALLEHFSWGSIFLVNIPIIVAAMVSGFFLLPESSTPEASPLDPIGVVLSIGGLVALVYATIEAPTRGWTSTTTLGIYVAAALLLLAFCAWEMRDRRPMLDLHLFENKRFTAAALAVGLVFFALFGSLFVLTQYLQDVLGYSPLGAGIRLLPAAIGIMIGAPASSRIAERIGDKIPVAFGLAMAAAGLWLLSTASVSSGYTLVLAALLLFSGGMGIAMTPATNAIMGGVPRGNAGIGAAINDTTRQVGGAFGVAVIGSILATQYRGSLSGRLEGVPAQAAVAARSSVGAAVRIADQVGGAGGVALKVSADRAFIGAMDNAFFLGATVALASSLLVLLFLPAYGPEAMEAREEAAGSEPAGRRQAALGRACRS